MANQIIFSATVNPANSAMEVSVNGGTTFTSLAFTTVGASQQGTLTGVVANNYPVGQLVLRAVGYAATTTLSNQLAVTVVNAASSTTAGNYLVADYVDATYI
jgi:hypothetical protein